MLVKQTKFELLPTAIKELAVRKGAVGLRSKNGFDYVQVPDWIWFCAHSIDRMLAVDQHDRVQQLQVAWSLLWAAPDGKTRIQVIAEQLAAEPLA